MIQDIFAATTCIQGAHEKPGNIFFFFACPKTSVFLKRKGGNNQKGMKTLKISIFLKQGID